MRGGCGLAAAIRSPVTRAIRPKNGRKIADAHSLLRNRTTLARSR